MEFGEPSVSQELARESLMAISQQSLPEKNLMNQWPHNSVNGNFVKASEGEGTEKYRSKLISISELSPGVPPPPPCAGSVNN